MRRVRRVVMFTPGHGEVGGAARRSRLLAQELAARGWSVRVVTRAGTASRLQVRRQHGLTVVEVPGFGRRRLGLLLYVIIGLPLGLVWSRRSDVLFAVQLMSTAMLASVCGLVTGRPYVASSTTSGVLSETAYIGGTRSSALRRKLLARADVLLAQTPSAADELRTLVAPERVRVLPNPVTPMRDAALTGRPRALYTGRLSEEKDLGRLLEAWRSIASEHRSAVLTLAGEGSAYRSVEDALRATVACDPVLTRSVVFRGWVADVEAELHANDVYVFPSLSEGMSNSLLEAGQTGRVIVCSDIAPNRAVLGDDYPLLFASGDTGDLLRALRAALEDEAVRSEAVRAVRSRMALFSVEAVTSSLEEVLEGAAHRARHQLA